MAPAGHEEAELLAMGVLLSKPNTEKVFDEDTTGPIKYAACSMQACYIFFLSEFFWFVGFLVFSFSSRSWWTYVIKLCVHVMRAMFLCAAAFVKVFALMGHV
jgi:hypothetical protein